MPNAILDPTGSVKSKAAAAAAPRARRPASLNGARVGLLINTKQNARPFLEEVGRLLTTPSGLSVAGSSRPMSVWFQRNTPVVNDDCLDISAIRVVG